MPCHRMVLSNKEAKTGNYYILFIAYCVRLDPHGTLPKSFLHSVSISCWPATEQTFPEDTTMLVKIS